MNLHRLDLNDIKGYGRKKPLLKTVFLLGSVGIAGIPGFNGYVSKTLLHESIVEFVEYLHEGKIMPLSFFTLNEEIVFFKVLEYLFLLTGGMTVAYMTKLFIAIFVEKNNNIELQAKFDNDGKYMRPLTSAVLLISAMAVPVFGLLSSVTLNRIADRASDFFDRGFFEEDINYFSAANLKGGCISIIIGAVIYLLFIRLILVRKEEGATVYLKLWPERLDLLTFLYEPLLLHIAPAVLGFICRCLDFFMDFLIIFAKKTSHRQLREENIIPDDFYFAYCSGRILNKFRNILNRTIYRGRPIKTDYILEFSEKSAIQRETGRIVNASSAFSLMMFSIGLIVVVVYLIFTSLT